MSTRIPLAQPHLAGNEERYLRECVETNFVSSVGPFVQRFEEAFAHAVGARHAVACASGTAAIHVALRVAGVEVGDDVAVSTFTFIASVNAVTYQGARPLLVDSERRTWNLDGERLHDEVKRRADAGRALPKVIEAVHVLGHPAEMEPILALRDTYGITIVEDAAEALGARYRSGPSAGCQVGTVGELGCFSFNGNKTITSGGGGMIVTDDEALAQRARHLTQQARVPGLAYAHDEVGYNYRLTNIAAAVGLAQLEQLGGFLDAKRRIALRYRAELAGLPLSPAPHASWAEPSFWLSTFLLEEGCPPRDVVLERLAELGVEARPVWMPVHRQRPYAGVSVLGGEVADDLYARGISLPCSVNLDAVQQETVIAALRDVLLG